MVLALWAAIGATSCGGETNSGTWEVRKSDIVNGTSVSANEMLASGLVAIYHPKSPNFTFYPRPCGGVIVRSVNQLSWVLTARHCTTTDESINGMQASPSSLRLIPISNPMPANPNPPAAAIAPLAVLDPTGNTSDMALILVVADWSSIANYNHIGLYVGTPQSLVGQSFAAYGYGISVNDPNCSFDNSTVGAGIARSATFTVGSGQSTFYSFTNSNSSGQIITCGDSGGPDEAFFNYSIPPQAVRHVIGVHTTGVGSPASTTTISAATQTTLGGLYVGAVKIGSNPPENKNLGAAPIPGFAILVPSGDSRQASIVYDSLNRRLTFYAAGGTWCLGTIPGVAIPWVKACDSTDPSQVWDFGKTLQLRSAQFGQCLTAVSDSSITLSACTNPSPFPPFAPAANQQWIFHAQP